MGAYQTLFHLVQILHAFKDHSMTVKINDINNKKLGVRCVCGQNQGMTIIKIKT